MLLAGTLSNHNQRATKSGRSQSRRRSKSRLRWPDEPSVLDQYNYTASIANQSQYSQGDGYNYPTSLANQSQYSQGVIGYCLDPTYSNFHSSVTSSEKKARKTSKYRPEEKAYLYHPTDEAKKLPRIQVDRWLAPPAIKQRITVIPAEKQHIMKDPSNLIVQWQLVPETIVKQEVNIMHIANLIIQYLP